MLRFRHRCPGAHPGVRPPPSSRRLLRGSYPSLCKQRAVWPTASRTRWAALQSGRRETAAAEAEADSVVLTEAQAKAVASPAEAHRAEALQADALQADALQAEAFQAAAFPAGVLAEALTAKLLAMAQVAEIFQAGVLAEAPAEARAQVLVEQPPADP